MALVGLGGVGKSQLAIEFTHRLREKRKDIWVFWVHAGTRARAEEGFKTIADTVKLVGRNQPTADIPQLVYSWLSHEANGRWVMVLDSVDDGDVFFGIQGEKKEARPLATCLPQSQNGSIIITTRDQGVAVRLTGRHQDTIPIGPMAEMDAVSLLEKRLGQLPDRMMAAALVQGLDCVPLAISQAAAYIQERGQQTSISKYFADFQASERRKTKLLAHDGGDLRRVGAASNAILITWQMSFNHIRETRRSAADLLSLMSFFDRQGIPERLLRYGDREGNRFQEREKDIEWDSDEDQSSQWSQGEEFEKDIVTLRNFSFVSDTRGAGFEMHGLVQLATRKWLEANGLLETWKQQFILNLCAEVPTGEYENWATWQELFPHAKSAMEQRPKAQESVLKWASILYKAAWYAWRMGNGADTKLWGMKAKKAREKILGEEHEDSIWSVAMVALGYELQGMWEEAEKLEVQVMESRKTKLGADHPSTLAIMNNLASTYWNQGRWEEAEKLQVQVMESRKTKLGADHPSTLSSMNNLASTYRRQGWWEKAEKLEVQVMGSRKTKLGADHPDTLTSLNNLASTYWNQGRWEKAEKLQVQVMESRKTKLGADHPDTLMSMANLASTYVEQGRWEEAENLSVEVMESRKTKLGADHPDTLTSMGDLALTYGKQGRWEEAEKLEVQVMERSKNKFGTDHPDTLTSMGNLASTYAEQGRWEEAERLFVEVMERSKTKLGADHPDALTSMANLASTYRNQGQWTEAEKLEVEVMESRKAKLGADHPDTLTSMGNLASTYSKQGRWEEAEKLQVQVMERSKTKLGADHPSTLTSMNNLASTYWKQGRWEEAEKLEVAVMETFKTKLGADHPSTLTSMANLAFVWKSQGRPSDAIRLMEDCALARQRVLGPTHPDTRSSLATVKQWSEST